jgi:hypothetical protein
VRRGDFNTGSGAGTGPEDSNARRLVGINAATVWLLVVEVVAVAGFVGVEVVGIVGIVGIVGRAGRLLAWSGAGTRPLRRVRSPNAAVSPCIL